MRPRSSVTGDYFGLSEAPTRMRQPQRYSRRGLITGLSGACKLVGSRQHGSLLERDLHTLIEADPSFERFALEAHSLVYFISVKPAGAQRHTYTPDVVAQKKSGAIVVLEAKAAALRAKPSWSEKERLIHDAYWEDHGVHFHVLTEFDIRREPRLTNCKIIVSRARGATDADLSHRLCDTLRTGPRSFRDLYRTLPAPRVSVFAAAMALVYQGKARFDLAKSLDDETVISEALEP